MSEFSFEIALCAHLESSGDLISRQLGTSIARPGARIPDIIAITPNEEFTNRSAITPSAIPITAIQAAVGVGRARYWKTAYDPLSIHPEKARQSMERAVEIGFFELERRNGREYIRQTTRYPGWIDRIRSIENKPDLSAPGDLVSQLRTDVALGVVDEVILATGSHVTRAHLNRIPKAVGVWQFRDGTRTVIRQPTQLPVTSPGIEPGIKHPTHTDITPITAREKARKRVDLGERAYGKGWRTYQFSQCKNMDPRSLSSEGTLLRTPERDEKTQRGIGPVPYCNHYEEIIDSAVNCGSCCPEFHERTEQLELDIPSERERTSPWTAAEKNLARPQSRLSNFSN